MVLRRMMGPSLETVPVLDAVLSVNYCANCDSVSVMTVQEECDEKGRGWLRAPQRYGVRSSAGPLLEKREKGRTPGYFVSKPKNTRVILPRLKPATPPLRPYLSPPPIRASNPEP